MHKLFVATVAALMFLTVFPANAEKGVNIFARSRPVPVRKIKNQNGMNLSLADFKGDFVVAVFWSRNCGPCLKELKSLNGFYKATRGKGVRLILISPAEEWASTKQQRRFLQRYGAPDVEFYSDPGGLLASDFGIFTSPHTVLINGQGKEIGRIRGSAVWDRPQVIDYILELKAQHG